MPKVIGKIHPAVLTDFKQMFKEGLKESASSGWYQVRVEWLSNGLPYPVQSHDVVNGFEMKLLDEFGIRWIFGWREPANLLVLFGAKTQRSEPVDSALAMVRDRVEGWT